MGGELEDYVPFTNGVDAEDQVGYEQQNSLGIISASCEGYFNGSWWENQLGVQGAFGM